MPHIAHVAILNFAEIHPKRKMVIRFMRCKGSFYRILLNSGKRYKVDLFSNR